MPLSPLRVLSPRRGALVASLAVVLTTAGLAGGGAVLPSAAGPPSVAAAGAADCATGSETAGNARVPKGSHAAEPNELTATQVAAAERRFATQARARRVSTNAFAIYPRVTVPVVVHVITGTGGVGAVTDSQIARQINVLNTAFAGRVNGPSAQTVFRFRLQETRRTQNQDWYQWSYYSDNDDVAAKNFLHQGTMGTLNVYVTGLQDGLLGYATFPEDNAGKLDGVVLNNKTLPGGSLAPYNLGDTATHEIGHWLGLYHTFQDSCVVDGDSVPDTPAQFDDSDSAGGNVYNCTANLDTCANRPGKDPVYNFMNYVDDDCMNRFTSGQAKRMAAQWYTFRNPT